MEHPSPQSISWQRRQVLFYLHEPDQNRRDDLFVKVVEEVDQAETVPELEARVRALAEREGYTLTGFVDGGDPFEQTISIGMAPAG